jgi:RNA polymerase sigma-70 factor (TIGR02960 family)
MMCDVDEAALLERARAGDNSAFDELVAPYRGELHAHCYRMLGSLHDADDALQEALIGAWKGLGGFEGRSSLRGWLYRIATHAAMRLGRNRSTRVLSLDHGPACTDPRSLGEPVMEPIWLEPYPDTLLGAAGSTDPAARYDVRESVEIAFVAALQHLPATQRAVVILRDVLAFSAAEVARLLETTVAGVNSALQRARATLEKRVHRTQRKVVAELGDERVTTLLESLVSAWERADVDAILDLLVSDAVLTMPPLPAWFDGREAVGRFMRERMFETPWRVRPASVNGQLALACYQLHQGTYRLGSLTALTLEGDRIAAFTSFLAPMLDDRFELSPTFPQGPMIPRRDVTHEG